MKPKQQQDSSMHTTTTTAQDNRDYDNNNNNNNNNNNSSNVNKSVYLINNKGQEENKPKNKKTRTIIACRQKSLNMNQQIRTNEKFGQKLSLLLLTNQNSVARIENSLSSLTMNSHEYNKHQSPLPLPPSPPPPPAVPVSIDTTFAIIHQSTSTRLYDKNDDYDMRKQMKHTNSGSNRSGKLTTTTTTLSSEHEGKQRSYGLRTDINTNNNNNNNQELIQRIHPTTVSSVSPSTTVTKTTTTMGTSLPTSSEIPESKYLNQSENTENMCLFGRVTIEIMKDEKSNLGLTVSDGSSQGEAPVILNIRPGSIADRSDCFLPYDHILSINFSSGSGETSNSGKQFGSKIQMEIGYELPALPPVGCIVKHMVINLKIGSEGVGLVIRGGWNKTPVLIRPLTVMHVRQNSAADCDGRIKPGDRILTINSIHTGQLTCEEAVKLIQSVRNHLTLTIEYNVANFEEDRRISGAVVVEIEKPANEDLGISLAPCHEVKTGQNAFFIDSIRQGSIADRCGALFEGDRVESIDDICVENMKLQEAMYRLKNNGLNVIRLQIVPNAIVNSEKPMQSNSDCLKSYRSLRSSVVTPGSTTPTAACRCEEVEVLLEPYDYIGYGFTLISSIPNQFSSELTSFPLIDQIDPRGPAFKSGVIQEGDRVICINGQSTLNRTIDELIQRYLQPIDFEKKYFRVQSLTLLIQYTVADSVVPATGIFDVKLIRRSASLGINLQASINKTAGQPLLISKVIPGSVASRSGSINPGDILLAVNGIHLSSCSLSEAIQLLQSPDEDIIVLRIKKMDTYSTTPGMTIKHGSDSSALHDYPYDGLQHRHYHPHQHQQKTSYRKSFDENLINKCTKSDTHYRTVQNEDSDDRGYSNEDAKKLSDNNTSSLSSFPPSQSTRKPHQHQHYTTPLQQYPIEKLFPSESEETRKLLYKHGDRNTGSPTHQEYQHRVNHCQNVKGQRLNQEELDNVLSHCMNLKLDSSIEPDMNVVQVILRRKSPDCPWGITICGTDDAPDIPVLIDSINPGDPGGECGLIQPGDRILAINGITLHNGHTLTQAMRMLQHFPDKVILHIARKSNFSSTTNNSLSIPTSAIVTCGGISIVQNEQAANKMTGEIINKQTECLNQPPLSRKCTLVKAVATSNFSRSFDSISNSFSSNSVSNNYSDGQPIVGRTPVFNSNINNKNANNNNIKVYSSGHYCDEIKQSVQKSKTIYDSKSGAQAMDMSWIVAGNQSEKNTGKEPITSSRSISKPSTTVLSSTSGMHSEISAKPIPVENLNLKVPSNKARSQKTQSHHRCSSSSSRRVNQPTVSQQQSHLLLQSSSNDEPQITEKERSKYSQPFVQQYLDPTLGEINDDNTPQHYNDSSHYPVYPPPEHQRHPYYTNQKYARSYTDYLQMDLNFIQCSGCRKAIEKDIKYYLSRQQKSFEAPRRASSSHRKDTTRSTSDAQLVSSHFEPDFDNAQLHHHQQQQQQYAQLHYSSGNNKSTANRMVAYEPSTSHYEQQHHQLQQTPLKQHSNYAEENSQGNKGKVTSSHMLTDHHSKSDSRLDLIRSIDLSEDSSDVDKRNSLSVSYPTKQTVKSSQMPAPQNKYNCQSPALDKTVSRIKSNTLGSPMNIKTSQSQFPNSIQRSHSKKSKSNKTSIAKSLKHDHFTELNTWCTWIRLKKTSTTDSYGIGVSEGISTLGIFVSAIRPNSPADLSGKLFLYDRILMVNDTPVDNLTCSEVVNLISRSEKRLDLLIQRRITKQSQRSKHSHQNEMVEFSNKSSHSGGSGVKSGVVCTSSIDSEHINITAL